MAIGENNPQPLIDDEAGGIAGAGGLGVEGPRGRGAEDDDGGDDLLEGLPPVLGGGGALAEGGIDVHGQLLFHGAIQPGRRRGTEALERIAHLRAPGRFADGEIGGTGTAAAETVRGFGVGVRRGGAATETAAASVADCAWGGGVVGFLGYKRFGERNSWT